MPQDLLAGGPQDLLADQPEPKKKFQFGGDTGAMISAADAYGALNKLLESSAYKAGGAVTDIASKAMSPEHAAAAGYLTNVGIQSLPVILGSLLGKMAGQPAMQSASKSMMQSALKPPIKDRMSGDAAKAIDTLLNEQVPGNVMPGASLTEDQVFKLRQNISTLGNQIKSQIASSNATINKGDVGRGLLPVLDQFKNQVNPQADINALKQSWLAFRNHPDLIGKTQIPVQTAQALKQGTYRMLGDKPYGELQGASVEAQKQLARILKEEIGKAVPGVSEPLAKQAALINAADLAERRVMAAGNNALLGLAPLGITPWSWLMFLTDRSPTAVSTIARTTNAASGALPTLLGGSAGALYANRQMGNPALAGK